MKILTTRQVYWLTQLNILALCVSLMGGFFMQFAHGEIPCPLCYLQRLAMMLCAVCLSHVVLSARSGHLKWTSIVQGYGLVIVSAVLGASISCRQILLHIVPPDPGFGSPVLGLHLYTWGFVVFALEILSAGLILMTMRPPDTHQTISLTRIQKGLLAFLAFVIFANMIAVFAAAGWHWNLPSDPTAYLLFQK